jgi:NTE family protein
MPEVFDVVFRGGGVKGIAFIGALARLQEAKLQTRRLIGTSAGAIFATCCAIGYTAAEMEKKIREKKDDKLLIASFLSTARAPSWLPKVAWDAFASTIDRMVRGIIKLLPGVDEGKAAGWGGKSMALAIDGAMCDDAPFREWLAEVLKAKEIDPAISLKDLHTFLNKKQPTQLTLIAADISEQQVLILNERTTPDLPLLEAVRMSMGIPFVWKEVSWQKEWGNYRGRDIAGHLVVDGGLLSNFPMRYFLDTHFADEKGEMGPPPGPAKEVATVGLMLDGTTTLPDLPLDNDTYLIEYMPAVRLASRLLDTMLDTWDKDALRQWVAEEKLNRYLCKIGTRGIGVLEFDLNDDRLAALINSGRCAMTEFLKGR